MYGDVYCLHGIKSGIVAAEFGVSGCNFSSDMFSVGL
jgi:hypothetical protein